MFRNYIDESNEIYDFFNNKHYNKSTELTVEVIPNAFVQPYKEIYEDGVRCYPRFGGVFNENLVLSENSKLLWQNPYNQEQSVLSLGKMEDFDSNIVEYIDEEVVYLGHLDSSFGHFLVDSMTRLWPFLSDEYKNKKAIYISDGRDSFLDILYIFGFNKDNLIRISKPTKFRQVLVPEPCYRFHFEYHEKYKEIFAKISNNVKGKRFNKIYLSRGKFCYNNTKCYGEKRIEKIFQQNGYKIIYPEKHSLKEQISLMKNATHIAGIAGSNVHLSLFANDGIDICIINRNKDNFITQLFINKMKNFNASFVDAFINPIPVSPSGSPSLIGLNQNMRDFFDDNNYKYSKKQDVVSPKDFFDFITSCSEIIVKSNGIDEQISLKQFAQKVCNMKYANNDTISIFYASDENYAKPLYASIISVVKNTFSRIDIHVLENNISKKSKKELKNLEKRFRNLKLYFHPIDMETFKNFPNLNWYSLNMYSRFFIPKIVPNLNKAIYLDVDIILKSDIKELYNTDLQGYEIGAVVGETKYINDKSFRAHLDSLKLSKEHWYFGSGVLVIDCEKWRQNNTFSKLIEIVENNKQVLKYPDQDALNIMYNNNSYKQIELYWNRDLNCLKEDYKKNKNEVSKCKLIHYDGGEKPWNEPTFLSHIFWKNLGFNRYTLDLRIAYYIKGLMKILKNVISLNSCASQTHMILTFLGIKIKIRKINNAKN